MPDLPDLDVYIERLDERVRGTMLADVRIHSPFLLRSVDPPLADAFGKHVCELRRIGKRIAIDVNEILVTINSGILKNKSSIK